MSMLSIVQFTAQDKAKLEQCLWCLKFMDSDSENEFLNAVFKMTGHSTDYKIMER